MMTRLATAILWLAAIAAQADDLSPATWKLTANTNVDVYVACYWAAQFPRFQDSAKHLVIACPKATWTNANPAKRTKILTALRRWLSGELEVSAARLSDLRADLSDANIGIALTDNPTGQLTAWGLQPPPGTPRSGGKP